MVQGDFDKFKQAIHKVNDSIFANAIHITDDTAINVEQVCGDDVAEIRTRIIDAVDQKELAQDDNEMNGKSMKLSFSYVSALTLPLCHMPRLCQMEMSHKMSMSCR